MDAPDPPKNSPVPNPPNPRGTGDLGVNESLSGRVVVELNPMVLVVGGGGGA